MEGYVKRIGLFLLCLGFFAALPAHAQIAGRWKLILENGSRASLQGELILTQRGGRTEGALLLENRDSAWIPLRDQRIDQAGTIEFSAGVEPLRFEGRMVNEGLEGTASAPGERRYRWRGVRLQPGEEYYAALPRFRQLQLLVGSDRPHFSIPGRWLGAAAALGENSEAVRAGYTEVSLRAGLTPLSAESLGTLGLYRAMGLFRREEMVRAVVSTLERVRAGLRSDTAVARFNYLFRPAGSWQVDIHDAALARARRPFPTLSWQLARAALVAANLLEDEVPGAETIPLALYRLFVLSVTDTAQYRTAEQTMRRADASSAAAVTALMQGYEHAAQWYITVMHFLLEQRWIAEGSMVRSPEDLVRRMWKTTRPVPELRIRIFGYPEGAVRTGTDSVLARSLLIPENAPAADWLSRHGTEKLMAVLHLLEVPYTERTRLNAGGEVFRLSSVQEFARESFSGFLEPSDVILLDPSYQPLLALGTLIHEWQHILHERTRQADPAAGGYTITGNQVEISQLDPFLAEGLAEWLTEEILGPALRDFPLLEFGEAEKRVSLPSSDPHQLGYILVRTLGRSLRDPRATLELLVRSGSDPARVVADPHLVRAWSQYAGPDRVIPRRGEPVLLPQATFTIEDGQPDLVRSEIFVPQD